MKTMNLPVGTRVVALYDLDPGASNARTGTRGYVMQKKTRGMTFSGKRIGPTFGPLVVWDQGGVCNVYPGQVAVLPADAENEGDLKLKLTKATKRMNPKRRAA